MTEGELWAWMMDGNYPPGYPDIDRPEVLPLRRRATATLSRDINVSVWVGHGKPEKKAVLKAGTKVKVVMASRLGDVGITDDLDADHGYHYRVNCTESDFVGVKLHPENLLLDIQPIEDPDAERVKLAFPEMT